MLDELLSGGLGTSFVSAHGSKLGVSEVSVGRTLVGITGEETDVASLLQEDVMCNSK